MNKTDRLAQERRALLKSFLYAFRGILFCIKSERNMRIHISVAVNIIAFSFVYKLTALEYGLLFFAIGFVLVCEMLNTSIEVVINMEMPAYHNLARIGKDVAAGAVFVAALSAVGVGLALFLHFPKLYEVLCLIVSTPQLLIGFGFLLIAGIFFSFFGYRLFQK